MNILENAHSGYQNTRTLTKTDRSLEYEAVAAVTARLQETAKGNCNFDQLVKATNENRNLWIFIASCVSDNENKLPNRLRAQLFFLSEFVALHTRKVLKGEADVIPLIDINVSVLRGLSTAHVA